MQTHHWFREPRMSNLFGEEFRIGCIEPGNWQSRYLNPGLTFWANTQEVRELDGTFGFQDFQGRCQLVRYCQIDREEAKPSGLLPQQNTDYFVDYQAFAQVEWKQGLHRPLVEYTGTFQAFQLYNTIPWGFEPSGASRIGLKVLTLYHAQARETTCCESNTILSVT